MSASDAESLHSKVAAVTLGFWVMKIAATTLGETAGDLLSMTLNLGYVASSAILLTVFATYNQAVGHRRQTNWTAAPNEVDTATKQTGQLHQTGHGDRASPHAMYDLCA